MARYERIFLVILTALNVFLYLRPRALTVFVAALVISTAALIVLLKNAFAPREQQESLDPKLKAFIVVYILTLNVLALLGLWSHYIEMKYPVVEMRTPMPSTDWVAFDGTKHNFRELNGHVSVLHFWATWCVPCRHEFPKLMAFARAHPEVTFLAFDVNDEHEKATAFLAQLEKNAGLKNPSNMLYTSDPDSLLAYNQFGIHGFPSSILVDAQGRMRRKYSLPVDWDTDAGMRDYLATLAPGKP